MSIDDYNSKFVRLARYVLHMAPGKKRWIRRFILGLRQPFFDVISPQVNVYPSYVVAVEAAQMVEYGQKTKGNNLKKSGHDHEGRSSGFGLAGESRSSVRNNVYSTVSTASVNP